MNRHEALNVLLDYVETTTIKSRLYKISSAILVAAEALNEQDKPACFYCESADGDTDLRMDNNSCCLLIATSQSWTNPKEYEVALRTVFYCPMCGRKLKDKEENK